MSNGQREAVFLPLFFKFQAWGNTRNQRLYSSQRFHRKLNIAPKIGRLMLRFGIHKLPEFLNKHSEQYNSEMLIFSTLYLPCKSNFLSQEITHPLIHSKIWVCCWQLYFQRQIITYIYKQISFPLCFRFALIVTRVSTPRKVTNFLVEFR